MFSVEVSKSAANTLTVRSVDGTVRRLHSLYDPEAEAAGIVDAFPFDGAGILVILGLGLGYQLAEFRRRYPGADIVVVEGKREIYDLFKEYGKAVESADRVRFIVGASPGDAIEEIASHQVKAGLPPLAVFVFAPELAAFPEYYVPIRKVLDKTASFRLWDRLRYPKFTGDRLTIALFDFGYFVTEEIARAAGALGHEVVRVPGNKEEKCGALLGRAIEVIATRRPDCFVTVNHIGFDEEGVLADFFESIALPAAIWYVDSPNLVVRDYDKNVSPYSFVFLWDESYIRDMKSLGFENVLCLPLAADESVFRPVPVSASERRKIGAAVGFVGNSMVLSVRDRLRKVPRDLHAAVDGMAKRFAMSRDVPFATAVEALMAPPERDRFEAMPDAGKSDFEAAVLWRATLLYRLSCIRELEEFHPRIRGDAGWKGLVGREFRLGPPLDYHKELPGFYNACTVNFNATNLQMGTAVNQRVFDVPACGAFLLTDHQGSIEGLFEVGKEVVTYKERGEIADLARFYLRNDAARETIARKGRERILAEHTYRHRIGAILRSLKETYA